MALAVATILTTAQFIQRPLNLAQTESPLFNIRKISGLLLSNPSDLSQIRSMTSFALITSNTKSRRLSRSSYTKATQSSKCCGVASIRLHFV
ncbi:hypothetical protein AVEN_70158-1 [Araneus ventricosus]|uniref:Uncharacterized protein n=1 Tax=Araneus ventricosus TaxID=182803 RepID=A0A4Y2HI32_ARAVE|nr:hypothetical protein AVEN_62530-1 [Araneus ventricosus]GBM65054.1 hypothetical protein AVEN_70158-1 [Araneus ventricosus]